MGDTNGATAAPPGDHELRLLTMPSLRRTSMAPKPWTRAWLAAQADVADAGSSPWQRVATLRRSALVGLVLMQTFIAADFMLGILPYQGRQPLEIAILALFAILFGWISAGFWTAMAGFLLLQFGGDRYAVTATVQADTPLDPEHRTAIVMPVYNENVTRVFAGLRATYQSLAASGQLRHFDFYILSDSTEADTCVAETMAWVAMCRDLNAFGRVYYRRRQHRIKRKSGNIADFCRRWGALYHYMVVLDADSVMSGNALVRLVQMMEANPGSGIIQTAPRAAGRETLYARVQQFATRVYGPLFAAGLHFWQLGESHYWGHNAIIRVAPFIRHCALSRLPGEGALSGEILSHDFVEAALMRRAGWAVWLAYDLPGSYEEMPPNLVDELKRDRRWCQGNLMNFRLFLMAGLHPAHRAVFMTGVMAYLSAPLWFLSLLLATALLGVHALTVPEYFVAPYQLFPLWPEWRPERAVALFSTTATLLFLPKLAAALLLAGRRSQGYGGTIRLTTSVLLEIVLSALLAPIRMLFHTQFVFSALLGRALQWKSPPREDAETTWHEALRRHGWHTALGVLWAAGVYALNPSFLWWLLPVTGALILSIPLSVYTSRVAWGRRALRGDLFVIPEERQPPDEIRATVHLVRTLHEPPGYDAAITDPLVNAVMAATAPRGRRARGRALYAGDRLLQKALREGLAALDNRERLAVLADAHALRELHRAAAPPAATRAMSGPATA